MELITIEAFADMIMQNNPTVQRRQLILRLHTASHTKTLALPVPAAVNLFGRLVLHLLVHIYVLLYYRRV